MLKSFSVTNFKCFKDKIAFDLGAANGYTFNSDAVYDGIIKAAIVYGHNASGKSNLALAMFDIAGHLTDNPNPASRYYPYLNADSEEPVSRFEYMFVFENTEVIYQYAKTDQTSLVEERLVIDGETVIHSDRTAADKEFLCVLPGTENLKKNVTQPSLSVIKYIRNNSELPDTPTTRAFARLFDFVERMLFFKSLDERIYVGKQPAERDLMDTIISKGLVEDYENFLNEAGIKCHLTVIQHGDRKTLARVFDTGKVVDISDIWSTGTSNLTLFYCWYQQVLAGKVSLLFIDEFDAFYHHELSRAIINRLKSSPVQFILTTHNTANMTNSLLRPDCYFLIWPHRIDSLSHLTEKELREAHNIEKMYKAGAFG